MKQLLRLVLIALAFAFLFPWLGLAQFTSQIRLGELPPLLNQALLALVPAAVCSLLSTGIGFAVGWIRFKVAANLRSAWQWVLLSACNWLAALGINVLALKLTGSILPQFVAIGAGWALLAGGAILLVIAACTGGLPMKVSLKFSMTTTASFKSSIRSRFAR